MRSTLFPGPVAVVDVETTGFSPAKRDRIVEIAAVVLNHDGQITREFVTLVNPERDIGATRIHGITSEDVIVAPKFSDIAPGLIESLSGILAIAGHNVQFDRRFLEYEFTRIQSSFPDCAEICTRQLAGGGNLNNCCQLFGIPHPKPHSALDDARATAQLLSQLIADAPSALDCLGALQSIVWPSLGSCSATLVTRHQAKKRQFEPPTYLQQLLSRVKDDPAACATDGAVLAYTSLLDRILEDRQVTDAEAESLQQSAESWGLSSDQVLGAHRDYMNHLALAALSDGIVSDAERRDLRQVGRLLGHDDSKIDAILSEASTMLTESRTRKSNPMPSDSIQTGTRVCFTGEMTSNYLGSPLTREVAEGLAARSGLEVVNSVTKKLDILVVADPHSQSGKAKKARDYGSNRSPQL